VSKTLYDLTAEYTALYDAMASGEDLTEEQVTALSDLSGDLTAKLDGYGCIIRELEGREKTLAEEIDRLNKWKTAVANHIRRLKDAALYALIMTEQTKVKTDRFEFSVRHTKPSVLLNDDEFIDWAKKCGRLDLIKVEEKPSKDAIQKALKAGEDIPATLIVKQSLYVR